MKVHLPEAPEATNELLRLAHVFSRVEWPIGDQCNTYHEIINLDGDDYKKAKYVDSFSLDSSE